jgi:cardiolipin synthase
MDETSVTAADLPAVDSPEERVQRAFERVSDAPLREGNRLSLLKNGPHTYDEWLEEIGRAKKWIHLENYIFKADRTGHRFAEALKEKVAEGVPVRVLYDWYGSKATPGSLWRELRGAGVDVRVFNPFSLGVPLEVFLRDHRKSLAVDGEYGSVGGVCIADQWVEVSPETGLYYRDTAVGFRGPAVADLERAFARVWDRSGKEPLPAGERPEVEEIEPAGEEAARLVIQEPGKMRIARMLQLIATVARERLWIADAYFMAGPQMNQALMSAARDGVDVRLLLPATNDLPVVGTISRAGYRQLLASGVRIFEYGGLMMHAKTTVADGWSSRIGSTNLNVTGLLTDWEIDLVVEGRPFGSKMEEMFEEDLADSREIRLGGTARRPRAVPERRIAPARRRLPLGSGGSGSTGSRSRAVATAARAGAAAFREGGEDLQRYERTVGVTISAGLLGTALLGTRFPRLLAWPLASAAGLVGATGLLRILRHSTDPKKPRNAGER